MREFLGFDWENQLSENDCNTCIIIIYPNPETAAVDSLQCQSPAAAQVVVLLRALEDPVSQAEVARTSAGSRRHQKSCRKHRRSTSRGCR